MEKARTLIADQILFVGNGAEPEALDPHTVTGVPEHHILTALFEGLVGMDAATLTPIPAVAKSWDISDDKKVYTFHLREDARWSNGESLTAKDFLYAWQRILTPALASKYNYMLYPIKNARAFSEGKITDFNQVGCKALDEHTVEVTLENPTPYFLQLQIHYTWFPVHQATIEKFGTMDERNTKWTRVGNMVSNGPYLLTKWEPNNVIETRLNEYYWNKDIIRLKGVNFYPVSDEQTEDRMFRSAELHMTENVLIQRVPVYQRENPQFIRTDPWIGSYFYRINITRKPFDDVRIRRALAMAVDRDAITTNILHGGETSGESLTPKNVNGYTANAAVHFDPEGAKALLAEAGYPDGEGFPTFEILYNTAEKHKIIAVAIQQMWKQTLGIDVQIVNQDWKVYLSSTSNDTMNYDVARAGWIGDFVDPVNFLECFTTGNGNNRTGWSNAEYDALIEESARTADEAARFELFQQAEAILTEEMPLIPIYHYTRPFLIGPEVKNFQPNLLGYVPYHTLWLE
ncbi:MAG: peptide ABC transporter substrate-binding protein [Candidatus Hydrogenedentota bacterium]|nr:MAG: peptide ABC transporter substrate-binding protein [Candidatus Hydrogenedentota bacterium]PCJ57103.1 MAG: peptide ABC transporter substrate-binding protein [Candidatus Hydrogenedentota bacterium]